MELLVLLKSKPSVISNTEKDLPASLRASLMPLESLQPTEYKESCVSFPVRAVKTSARCSHDTRQPPLMEGV